MTPEMPKVGVPRSALRAAMNAEFCGRTMRDALMCGTDWSEEVLEAAIQAALAEMLVPMVPNWELTGQQKVFIPDAPIRSPTNTGTRPDLSGNMPTRTAGTKVHDRTRSSLQLLSGANEMNNQAAQTMPTKFRKKPVVIEAVQFTREMAEGSVPLPEGVTMRGRSLGPDGRFPEYANDGEFLINFSTQHSHLIETLEGNMDVQIGDWVITGVKGERYPCKPDIFAMTYEPAAALSQPAGLRELVQRWRESGKAIARICADELESLLTSPTTGADGGGE